MRMDLMNISYTFEDKRPVIVIYGRDKDWEKRSVKVRGFRPYYYQLDENGEYETVFSERCRKVVCRTTGEVSRQRDNASYEADIPFTLRYLIDKEIYVGLKIQWGQIQKSRSLDIPPRIVYFDIEVMSPPEKFPKAEDADYPIVAISVVDSYDKDERRVFFIDDYKSEREMVDRFFAYCHKFDIVAGYYSNMFDVPYIVNRCKKLRLSVKRWSPLRDFTMRTFYGRYFISCSGLSFVDMFTWYRNMLKSRGKPQIDLDLKSVVKYELGYSYEDYGDRIQWLYENDREKLREYAMNDAVALYNLDKQLGMSQYYDVIRRIAGCPFEYVESFTWIIDTLLLRLARKEGYVAPSKSKPGKKSMKKGIRGATVKSPEKGLYENVAVFDFASTYPNIIINDDLSPDDKKLIPELCKILVAQRKEMKEAEKEYIKGGGDPGSKEFQIMYYKEQSFKFLVNSIYGAMAYPGFRWFNAEIAARITKLCREALKVCEEEIYPEYRVIYGDTDSLHILCDYDEISKVEERLNSALKSRFGAKFRMEFERYFKRILFKGVKKRYVAHVVWDNRECSYIMKKGVEAKRSDSAQITIDMMNKFFEMILLENDVGGAIRLVWDYKRRFRKMADDDWKYVAIPKSINKDVYSYEKDSPHVRGLKFAMERYGLAVREDKRPLLLWVKGESDVIVLYSDVEGLPDGIKINYQLQRQKVIDDKIKGWVEALGYDWKDGSKERKLDEWFGGS